jgi:hypothetical protein
VARAIARAYEDESCRIDLGQTGLSLINSVLGIGIWSYGRSMWSLATSPGPWADLGFRTTTRAATLFTVAPVGALASGEFERRGGTSNPFQGPEATVYRLLSASPWLGTGLKLGEAINSCTGGFR